MLAIVHRVRAVAKNSREKNRTCRIEIHARCLQIEERLITRRRRVFRS